MSSSSSSSFYVVVPTVIAFMRCPSVMQQPRRNGQAIANRVRVLQASIAPGSHAGTRRWAMMTTDRAGSTMRMRSRCRWIHQTNESITACGAVVPPPARRRRRNPSRRWPATTNHAFNHALKLSPRCAYLCNCSNIAVALSFGTAASSSFDPCHLLWGLLYASIEFWFRPL